MDFDATREQALGRLSTLIRQAELYHTLQSRRRGHMGQGHPAYAELNARTDEASARVAAYIGPCIECRVHEWVDGHALFSAEVQQAFEKRDLQAARHAVAECIERKYRPFPRTDADGNDIGFDKAEAERARRLVAVFADERNVLQLPGSDEALLAEIARNETEIASWNDPAIQQSGDQQGKRAGASRFDGEDSSSPAQDEISGERDAA